MVSAETVKPKRERFEAKNFRGDFEFFEPLPKIFFSFFCLFGTQIGAPEKISAVIDVFHNTCI